MERRNYTSNRQKVNIKIYDYRPITLLNIAHKISAVLLNKRFSVIVKKKKKMEQLNGTAQKNLIFKFYFYFYKFF